MHAFTKIIAPAFIAASLVAAAPLAVRQEAVYDDATILQYALTLEHLEATFYRTSLNMLGADAFAAAGYAPWVRQRFTEIASHEKAHVDFLVAGLTAAGAAPVAECQYNFGINSVASFIATSQVLENVGVSAYLGAAPSITNKAYLAYAGSILVIETQHNTWGISAADTQDPFPKPFAASLDFNQVYTLAAPFITSCPASNIALPFHTFPSITVETAGPYSTGQSVSIKIDQSIVDTANANGQTLYYAFASTIGTQYVAFDSNCETVVIPPGVNGQSYLLVVNGKFLCDAATVAGPAILNVGLPAYDVAY